MIRTSISIDNPWFKEKNNEFLDIHTVEKQLTENKYYCFQVSKYNDVLLKLLVDSRWRNRDHGGVELEFTLLGYTSNMKLYDRRHWNYDEGRWMTSEEHRAEMDNFY